VTLWTRPMGDVDDTGELVVWFRGGVVNQANQVNQAKQAADY